MSLRTTALAACLALVGPAHLAAQDPSEIPRDENGEVVFRKTLNNAPLPLDKMPDQEVTEAVQTFRETGDNPYAGDADAAAEGAEIYARLCQACHMPDGSGRIGPNFQDDQWERPRTHTDVGRFEVIYGGGAGAMQAFGDRLTQDEILQVMAHIDTFRQ